MKRERDIKTEGPVVKVESKIPPFEMSRTDRIQSPYLNLQAAGSPGHDSSKGIHLRWFLDGFLGENHLPKGNYAGNGEFFNKKEDFVYLYRVLYDAERRALSPFYITQYKPNIFHHDLRLWIYFIEGNTFYLKFLDPEKYSDARNTVDPADDPFRFMDAYGNGLYELELKGKLSFAVNFGAKRETKLKVESFSVQNKSSAEDVEIISARRSFLEGDSAMRIVAENIKKIRFSVEGSLTDISFEPYIDLLQRSVKYKSLEPVGGFALTKDKTTAFVRLEDKPRFKVHKEWLKFNDACFVNVKNYQDRWSVTDGLKQGVTEYIFLSDSDPVAAKIYEDDLDPANPTVMDISLLEFLNVAAADFHIARMLGLGYIDTPKSQSDYQQYIYLAVYKTLKDPENYYQKLSTQHLYMSLPTGLSDERLPQELTLGPITYGLTVSNGTNTPLQITDSRGYTLYDNSRYIRLRADLKIDYQKSVSFFDPAREFESSKFSSPVFAGFENRKEGEAEWIKPEIAHDDVYLDTDEHLESSPPVFRRNASEPTYIHEVTVEGVDEYAAYPVNIFSRASDISNIRKTDKTVFKKANTLRAPTNLTVQLIQAENPLLLTSQAEQQWLAAIDPDQKEILCRVTFDYYHIHDLNYRYGNKARLYHKKRLPMQAIGSLTSLSNNDTSEPYCILETGDYTYLSTGEVFVPKVDPLKKDNFIGGNLSYQSKLYIVEDIILTNANGEYPKIKIRKIETREAILVDENYQVQQIFQAPSLDPNDAFLLVENLAKSENWAETTSNRLPADVELGLSSWVENTETYTDSEGNEKQEIVKGIWDDAKITAATDGVYEVEFKNAVLNNHPQYFSPDNIPGKMSVNWYRGYIRVRVDSDTTNTKQRKDLRVELISEINTGNKLKLLISDPNFSTTDPGENIKTGNAVSANFHPGYIVYLRKHDPIEFNQTAILPEPDEGTRNTLLGIQSLDTTMHVVPGVPYSSPMGAPALLAARELIQPKQPLQPIGSFFANPPDFYNKANYSFTTEFQQKPWGVVFYRADSNRILSSLYQKETIEQILQDLPPVKEDEFLGNRWQDLLSFDYTANGGDFGSFPVDADGNTYKFPKPDREDIFTAPYDVPEDVVDLIKNAIFSTILPITEQPLIFNYIKGGNYVPKPGKQKITDSSGKILDPSHPDFDQAPMAKHISDTKLLFTDFTLDGNMDSQALYFYTVREMSNSLKLGEPSAFVGPVRLLNTKAPEKLNLKKITSQIGSVYNDFETAVLFEINKIAQSQEISKIQILRTLDSANALSARNMSLIKEIDISTLDTSGETIQFKDDFESDSEIPYGLPLYYRLMGVREIDYLDHNNSPETMRVFSEATNTLLANVIDLTRPLAPTPEAAGHTATADEIQQIVFTWNKTCYNGKYRLCFLEGTAWQKLSEIQTNDETQLTFTYDCKLPVEDDAGNKLYYKFKVDVENSAGMVNQDSKIIGFSV